MSVIKWKVQYEARPHGAIGAFNVKCLTSTADTESEALDEVRAALNAQGFETRFPVGVSRHQVQP
jgi:hypothetical protein